MSRTPTLLSIIELGGYPSFTPLYERAGYTVTAVVSVRKALGLLKTLQPDVVVAEFNYQSDFRDRTSSLESLLAVVQRSPQTRVIVFYEKEYEHQFDKAARAIPVVCGVVLSHCTGDAGAIPAAAMTTPIRWLQRLVAVEPAELSALLWSFAYFFLLLCSYYILRPLRDEMGIAGGVQHLPWVFTGTFVVMLAAVPLFGFSPPVLRGENCCRWCITSSPRACCCSMRCFKRANTTPSRRARSSSGPACSICSWCRCSGVSWWTSTPTPRRGGCSAASPPAAAPVRSPGRWSPRHLPCRSGR